MRQVENQLTRLARSVVEPMGYELVGVEHFQRGTGGAVVRVYIDRIPDDREAPGPGAITLDDCRAVSHQLSGVLDVEDPIAGQYDLEISSPGLDRPLFTAEHFERFHGRQARIELAVKQDGRRNLTGQILGLAEDAVLLRPQDQGPECPPLRIPLDMIASARLVPDLEFGNRR